MRRPRDPGSSFFQCTDGERATFEAGIKLGTIYHQYTGIPLDLSTAGTLERTIEAMTKRQPFVEQVSVKISRRVLRKQITSYGYASLSPEMLTVKLAARYGNALARCEMRFVDELRYPLMFVRRVLVHPQGRRRRRKRGR
jgi:hypothetical protein